MGGIVQAGQPGIEFGPNGSGKRYLSLYAHRGANYRKSMWAMPPPEEYRVFCSSDYGNWSDHGGNLWGIDDGGNTVLGLRGERLSKFPRPTNATNPWHGYPVSPMEDGDRGAPPDLLVERWISTGVVSRTIGRRIQRGRL